eukprot:366379-Chlamydomonas_euryale.AAC.15
MFVFKVLFFPDALKPRWRTEADRNKQGHPDVATVREADGRKAATNPWRARDDEKTVPEHCVKAHLQRRRQACVRVEAGRHHCHG